MYQGDKITDPEGRRTLPPFVQVRATALVAFVAPSDGILRHPVIYSVWAWQREQDEVKRECYDDLAEAFQAMAKIENLDPLKAFPPPAGMDEWRKAHPTTVKQEDIVKQEAEKKKAEQKQ
jgi:hypothetical protein